MKGPFPYPCVARLQLSGFGGIVVQASGWVRLLLLGVAACTFADAAVVISGQ